MPVEADCSYMSEGRLVYVERDRFRELDADIGGPRESSLRGMAFADNSAAGKVYCSCKHKIL